MTGSDRERFVSVLEALCASFRVEPSEALLEGYWLGLSDLALADVQRAAVRAIRECQHMPRPVELRKLTGEMGAEGRAVRAWSALKGAIAAHGAYRSVDFDDPLVNATVRNLGGWPRLCATATEEFEKWTRKDFERIYSSLMQHGASEEQVMYLPGITETENGARGYEAEPPRRVLTGLPAHRDGLIQRLPGVARGALRAVSS